MTMSIYDLGDEQRFVQFSNGHFERLVMRGVLMPAGVFMGDRLATYFGGRHNHVKDWSDLRANEAEARGCAMTMRAYCYAVRLATETATWPPWCTRLDTGNLVMEDALVELLATCRGFGVR